jgi:tRNA(Ile)-lysidine synthase
MPSQNSLKDKILAKVTPKDRVILGLSGGPDSVFLFHLLRQWLKKEQLVACHINYGLRGQDSNKDQKFVEELCDKFDIQLETLHAPASITKGNLENNCRNFRYDFFEKTRSRSNAKLIIVAHHLNDQIETFFLNILRGSSLRGFQGMQGYDNSRKLWRPLLEWPKKEIIKWLKKHKFTYRLDKSNLSKKFTRNRIRHEIIPLLEKINPNFINTAGNSLIDLQNNLKLVESKTETWLLKNIKPYNRQSSFELETFMSEPAIMQKNIIRTLFQNTHQKSLTSNTISEILNTLNKNRAGLRKEFGKSTTLKIIKESKKNKRIVVIEHELD